MAKKLKTQRVEAINPNDFARIKIDSTQQVIFNDNKSNNLEQELSLLTKKELLYRLNFEETDPDNIKMIKKIIKTKA